MAHDGGVSCAWAYARVQWVSTCVLDKSTQCNVAFVLVKPRGQGCSALIHRRESSVAKESGPQLDFRCSRWAPQKQIATEVDRLQAKMTATLLRLPYVEGERPEDYVRRRGRLAKRLSRKHGLWSERWFQRATKWDEHLARPRNARYWAAKLRCYHDRDWFVLRRSSFVCCSIEGKLCMFYSWQNCHKHWQI